ncbi:hypothetical protein CERSUDRAFT_98989 [Gelatoporia subvermispora B]|uniref:Uncharacterized protein n=1 Tax=Ceriporiopsis subvermispora (strain B) TaxID=914234 RepID=M2R464_CERS8|nr:hypothetical protein CERSUDRAFT_98989 [Gelatoporia subvermispora B]
MDACALEQLEIFAKIVPREQWKSFMKSMKDEVANRIAGLPDSLKPGASDELVKQAPAMPKLQLVLFKQFPIQPYPPRLCYGYILDKNRFIRIAWNLGAEITNSSGIATLDAVNFLKKQIRHELECVHVWLDGSNKMIISFCSNWDEEDDLRAAVRAARRLKDITGEEDMPKWYLDTLHSQWTWKPELW